MYILTVFLYSDGYKFYGLRVGKAAHVEIEDDMHFFLLRCISTALSLGKFLCMNLTREKSHTFSPEENSTHLHSKGHGQSFSYAETTARVPGRPTTTQSQTHHSSEQAASPNIVHHAYDGTTSIVRLHRNNTKRRIFPWHMWTHPTKLHLQSASHMRGLSCFFRFCSSCGWTVQVEGWRHNQRPLADLPRNGTCVRYNQNGRRVRWPRTRLGLKRVGPDWSLKRKPDAAVLPFVASSVQPRLKLFAVTM
jgi:hypothetical protein